MKLYFKLTILLLWFSTNGCDNSYNNKQSGTVEESSETVEIEESETAVETDSLSYQVEELYCCSNHTPKHCGNAIEIDKLAASGCTGFVG